FFSFFKGRGKRKIKRRIRQRAGPAEKTMEAPMDAEKGDKIPGDENEENAIQEKVKIETPTTSTIATPTTTVQDVSPLPIEKPSNEDQKNTEEPPNLQDSKMVMSVKPNTVVRKASAKHKMKKSVSKKRSVSRKKSK